MKFHDTVVFFKADKGTAIAPAKLKKPSISAKKESELLELHPLYAVEYALRDAVSAYALFSSLKIVQKLVVTELNFVAHVSDFGAECYLSKIPSKFYELILKFYSDYDFRSIAAANYDKYSCALRFNETADTKKLLGI